MIYFILKPFPFFHARLLFLFLLIVGWEEVGVWLIAASLEPGRKGCRPIPTFPHRLPLGVQGKYKSNHHTLGCLVHKASNQRSLLQLFDLCRVRDHWWPWELVDIIGVLGVVGIYIICSVPRVKSTLPHWTERSLALIDCCFTGNVQTVVPQHRVPILYSIQLYFSLP